VIETADLFTRNRFNNFKSTEFVKSLKETGVSYLDSAINKESVKDRADNYYNNRISPALPIELSNSINRSPEQA